MAGSAAGFIADQLVARQHAGVKQHQESLEVRTPGRGAIDLSRELARIVATSGVRSGLAVVFCAHTSASLLIQENADPAVRRDLLAWLERLAPDGDPRYEHSDEGPDDMAAHLRSSLGRSSESIPIVAGTLVLGRWQALYLVEHRTAPHRRRVVVHVSGE
ncbi:MAG: YjbQ family protein [Planctomycetes bacterium]|nr:YjbQ family protein [Planctomycetota bacterium]